MKIIPELHLAMLKNLSKNFFSTVAVFSFLLAVGISGVLGANVEVTKDGKFYLNLGDTAILNCPKESQVRLIKYVDGKTISEGVLSSKEKDGVKSKLNCDAKFSEGAVGAATLLYEDKHYLPMCHSFACENETNATFIYCDVTDSKKNQNPIENNDNSSATIVAGSKLAIGVSIMALIVIFFS